MTDSPSDAPSGSFSEESELFEFLDAYLRQLAKTGLPVGSRPGEGAAAEGPDWCVVKRGDGSYAVQVEGTGEVAGVFQERARAYLVAATLTAAGPHPEGSEAAQPGAVAEPAAAYGEGWGADPDDQPIERRKEIAARTIRGLLANPKAAELFVQAVDPEVLREALAIRDQELDERADEAN